MNREIYTDVLEMDDAELTRAVIEEIMGREVLEVIHEPWMKHPVFMISGPDNSPVPFEPMSWIGIVDDWNKAWELVSRLQTMATGHPDGDLLMDHVSSHLDELICCPMGGSATCFFTQLLSRLTPTMLVRACLMGVRSWRLDPEDY